MADVGDVLSQMGLMSLRSPSAIPTSGALSAAVTSPSMVDAQNQLNLSPEETALYQRHLLNLYGSGGVDNADGSRSTLYQAVQQHDGKFYNVPTVWDGKRETEPYTRPSDGQVFDVPNATAGSNIAQAGWNSFPSYATPEQADSRYDLLHKFMERDTADFLKNRKR